MKYIVKNCPALRKMITISSAKRHETLFDSCSEGKHSLCADRTDCPIKQIVNECKSIIEDNACTNCKDRDIECWQCENEYRYRAGLPELDLPKQILQILQVEEVE